MGVGQAMQGGGSNISLSSAELRFVMLAKSRQGSMRCDAGVGFVLVDSELVSEECTWQQGGRSMKKWEGKGGCVEERNAIDRVVLEPRHWIAAYQGTPWPTTQFRGEPEIRATHPLQPSSGRRGNQVSNETSKRFSVPGRQIKLLDPGHLFSKDQVFRGSGRFGKSGLESKIGGRPKTRIGELQDEEQSRHDDADNSS